MKRFHIFYHGYHDAGGGIYDYLGSYRTLDEAKKQGERFLLDQKYEQWVHIAKTQDTGDLVGLLENKTICPDGFTSSGELAGWESLLG
jgi:hypothetical protein